MSSHGKIRNTRSRLWPKTVIENYEKREDSKLYFSALSFTVALHLTKRSNFSRSKCVYLFLGFDELRNTLRFFWRKKI